MTIFLISILLFSGLSTQNTPEEKETLTLLLEEFLEGASTNDIEVHKRFWAEELIYTGSAGNRTNKAEIIESLKMDSSGEASFRYLAEDIIINLYGTTAVVAFKLVAVDQDGQKTGFYNTGTFVKRNNNWQAVSWQATRIP